MLISLHIVTCAEIARERGWHRTTALRWLKKLRAERGEEFAWMKDGEWATSREVLQRLADEERNKLISRLEPRITKLEEELSEERRRNDVLAAQVLEFRQKANEWLKRERK